MRNTLAKIYLTNFLTGIVFWYGIEKLFMQSIGISPFGIAVNATVYVVFSMLFNIPAGILADRWSRKYCLMIAVVALGLSSFMLGSSHSLGVYLVGTAVWALYLVLTTGTFQALIYDCLAETGRAHEYVKHQGRSHAAFLAGVGLSSVIGGYMAHALGYRAAFMMTIAPCVVNFFIMMTLHEPKFHKDTSDTKLWQHIHKTFKLITGQQLLLFLSMMLIVAFLVDNVIGEYSNLYFIALGMGAIGNGWASAGKWLSGAFGQFLANALGKHTRWLIPVLLLAFAAFSLFHSPVGLIFFYIATFVQAIVLTNVEGVIQHHTPSNIRATVISVLEFVNSGLMIPIGLAFGYLAKHSIFTAYQFVSIILLVFGAIWLLRPKSIRKEPLHSVPTAELTAPSNPMA
jgi:MFS family permease